jgi:hypothetical protein
MSDQFVTEAEAGKNGITCRTKELSEAAKKYLRPDQRFMPKTLKFLLFVKEEMGIKDLIFIALVATMILMMRLILGIIPGVSGAFEGDPWLIYLLGFFLIGATARSTFAPWHGAEHMAIAAYERFGSTCLEAIERESPVNAKCGTRFAFPMIVSQILVVKITDGLFVGELASFAGLIFFFLITLECLLWIDFWFGFDKLPVTRQVSYLIQKYIVTKRPGEIELRTAQMAMIRLLVAHRQAVAQEPTKGSFLLTNIAVMLIY